MNIKKLSLAFLASLICFDGVAYANEVRLNVNRPMTITYRLAYEDIGRVPVLGKPQSILVNESISIPVNLKDHTVVGIVLVSADGHVLPDTANRFNKPNQCSMTTDAKKSFGEVAFFMDGKNAVCKTKGGIFG